MASRPPQPSLPPYQQFSQQQASSPPASEASSSQEQRRSSIPQSATSEDSQTVFLHHPSPSESSHKPESQQRQISPRPKPQTAPSNKEPRKCWICFSDETEDDPTSSEWRSPCPCALTAHEACLLDWVADLESPKNRQNRPPKIQCPQCKATITIARPRSLVVEGVQAVERATGRLVLPFVMVTLVGTVITGCWMHGFSTVYLIFGPEDAEALMSIDRQMGIASNWGLALPFIPLTLLASRKTLADSIFPIIPLVYFASNPPQRDGPLWPPSVAMTMATLPYIRAAYNELYARILVPKEKAWTKEIQPRAGETGDGDDQEQNNGGVDIDVPEGLDFELDLQVEIVEQHEVPEGAQQQHEQPANNPPAAFPLGGNPDRVRERFEQEARERHAHHHHVHDAGAAGIPGGGFLLRPKQLAETVIGALIFPTISAAMGVLLEAVLPRSWTLPPRYWERYPAGFLSSRFGRSIAGGFLFIVLRDTFSLYSKYRLAQSHKHRRIVDYQGKSKAKKAEEVHEVFDT